ncbi:MAG: MFS transporter [Sphingomonas sp.]|uniref:MFS transporter n=1 Tax=Sphingomonas sp. TaxID=28214 RepID=UPI001AC532D0|nr:MFS transporter [Sphingomonas sp.]MBN8814703.1 MFS transporter [Sphingomonas sp.]
MLPADHPLRIANFRAYWLSRFLGTIAVSAQGMVIGWQVYGLARETMDIKQAAFMLGMIGLVQFVPLFVLTPVVGLAADTFDRRWIVRITTTVLVANAALLGLLTSAGALSLPVLFAAASVVGVVRAFSGPAYGALAPNLVPRESLPTAIAVSSIAWQTGTIAGPSLGGVLYALHPDLAYGAIAGMLMVALGTIFLIGKVPQPPAEKDRHPLQRILDGFAYVRDNRLVLAAITLDLFVVLLAGAVALLPVYARDILHVGASGLGLLAAGMGIGASAGSIWFSIRPLKSNVGVKMLVAVIVFAIAILTFGFSTWFPLSVAALVVAGAADMVSVYVRSSLIQLHTPDSMRGRVGAVSQLTISASNELGEAETGLMASLLGPVGAVAFGGIAAIVITLVWSRLFPELRLAKTFDPPEMVDLTPDKGVTQP